MSEQLTREDQTGRADDPAEPTGPDPATEETRARTEAEPTGAEAPGADRPELTRPEPNRRVAVAR